MKLVSKYALSLLLIINSIGLFAQDYPYDIYYYNFIHYKENKFVYPGDSSRFEQVFEQMDSLILYGKGNLDIAHIGGSHIQADIYSGQMRKRLQSMYPGLNAGRGYLFPYRLTKTNSPRTYKTSYTGSWQTCKNVERKKHCRLGIAGVVATTFDRTASLTFELREEGYVDYDINRVKIFYQIDSLSYQPDIDTKGFKKHYAVNDSLGYLQIDVDGYLNNIKLVLSKTDSLQKRFVFYGISVENDDSGIRYHAFGINGASLPSFLKCALFEQHAEALDLDLIIISLGTNDAYTTKFNPQYYYDNYEKLIQRIRKRMPETAILLTVSNDSYMYRRYPNKNTALTGKEIMRLAEKYDCGVWDFYQIMGGFNSSALWYKEKLMVSDRIHFSINGYLLKGDLFFNAFLKSYDNHLLKRQLSSGL